MARIRTIKPEFWTDSFMVQLPPLARLIYISLWTAADDHGLISDEPERLAMEVMPREDGLTFDDWFQFFETTGRVERFFAPDGSTYFRIAKWEIHQRVDKPGKSRISREDSRKVAIPLEVRRKVASKYKCAPGETVDAQCFYCGAPGQVHWHKLFSGRPSNWVTFPGLELDHVHAEGEGGKATIENIVLACRGCNRSKRDRDWIEFLCSVNLREIPAGLAKPREASSTEQGTGKGREQGREGKGRDHSSPPLAETAQIGLANIEPATAIADLGEKNRERLKQVTADAISTFNAILGKPNGALAAVHLANDVRESQIRRCVPVARDICQRLYGSTTVTEKFWTDYWTEVDKDEFKSGKRAGGKGHENWKPDFDYLTRKDVMTSVFDKAMSEAAA